MNRIVRFEIRADDPERGARPCRGVLRRSADRWEGPIDSCSRRRWRSSARESRRAVDAAAPEARYRLERQAR